MLIKLWIYLDVFFILYDVHIYHNYVADVVISSGWPIIIDSEKENLFFPMTNIGENFNLIFLLIPMLIRFWFDADAV